MPSFYIDSYTDTSITICINVSSSYTWYFILVTGQDTQVYYLSESGEETFKITGLSSGEEYVVEVRCNNTYDEDSAISLGSETVTTSGNGSGGTDPDPDEPDPDEPDTGTYIAYIKYNANGGTGAPSKQTFYSDYEYIEEVTIPTKEPTRDGYIFLGWATKSTATSVKYEAGKTYYDTFMASASESGYTTTLYAVWSEEGSNDGCVYIGGEVYIPYIYNGSEWVCAEAYVYNGSSWKITGK